MIPLRDENPTTTRPVVTWALIAVCVAVFLLQGAGHEILDPVTAGLAMIPARVLGDRPVELPLMLEVGRRVVVEVPPAAVPEWLTLLTCTFLHGSWLHLLGNVWVLFIFGDNVEERFGRWRYLAFYLASGVLASATHLATEPSSPIPTVGASGAIAGVMGAYLLLYPRARVLALIPLGFFLHLTVVPAALFLGLWFLLQVLQGVVTLGGEAVGGVAWWAHIGGFAAGVGLAALLRHTGRLRPQPTVIQLRGGRMRRGGVPPRRPWI
ncbi:MAG: rhomboid family intramembrane serine protease [Planctomycetota bacterium]